MHFWQDGVMHLSPTTAKYTYSEADSAMISMISWFLILPRIYCVHFEFNLKVCQSPAADQALVLLGVAWWCLEVSIRITTTISTTSMLEDRAQNTKKINKKLSNCNSTLIALSWTIVLWEQVKNRQYTLIEVSCWEISQTRNQWRSF